MSGFIQLHRKMRESVVFQDPYYLKLWIWLLFRARYKEGDVLLGNQVIHLEVGQLIWGREEATIELNQGLKGKSQRSSSSWETYLKNLEKLGKISRKPNSKYTLVTIDKYEFYQNIENDFSQQANSKLTANKQQANTKNKDNKGNKDNNYSNEHLRLAEMLKENIKKEFPNKVKNPDMDKWADEVRKICEIDKETIESIEYVIKWLPTSEFWYKNILSPAKLRKQFEQLKYAIKAEKGIKPNGQPVNKPKTARELQEEREREWSKQ